MRSLLVLLFVAASVTGANSAQAERRIFIIANNADGYGVDRCLANGAKCGAAMARAYCRSRDFKRVVSYHRVRRQDITGGIPADSLTCGFGRCDEFVAIECAR